MKAIRQTIQLSKGLSPAEAPPPNGKWLAIGQGVRMGLGGLELPPTPTDPLSVTTSWPWPQLINLRREIIVVQSDGLYLAASDWSLSQILAVSVEDSTVWQIADYGDYWYGADGENVYVRDVSSGTIEQVSYDSFPQVGSLVNFRGQLVGCALQSEWNGADSRFAVWSNIGSNSFDPDWKNEAGWRDMEIGSIYRCLNLADQGIVFYGDEGVAMLTPAGNTFGYQRVSNMPAIGALAMGGWKEHLYVNSEAKLVRISSEGIEPLGYRWVFSEMDSSLLRISTDPVRGDYYIFDDSACYIYANGQLTESNILPTALTVVDGSLVGAHEDLNRPVLVELQEQDLNLVGMKSIEFLEVGVQTDGEVWGDLRFSYQLGEDSRLLGFRPANESGFVYLGATANLFQPRVRVVAPSSMTLPYLTYGVKVTDNRIQNQLQTMSGGGWNVN